MPIGILKILDEELPRLEAEQMLGLHRVLVAANGRHLNKTSAAAFERELRDKANAGRRPQRPIKATAEDLRKLGIPVYQKAD